MEARIQLALTRANQRHLLFRRSLPESLLPELLVLVSGYLPAGRLLYHVEHELFFTSRDNFQLGHGVGMLCDHVPILAAFRQQAYDSLRARSAYVQCSLVTFFQWIGTSCNRGICYATNVCICDDPLTGERLDKELPSA